MYKKTVYLSLGSNIGDRLEYLKQATKRLAEHDAIDVINCSSIYETTAWGVEDQADFYNSALTIKTNLKPKELLSVCQKIEFALDRTREFHWGPRTIDIDILLYEGVEMEEEELTIPHKYLFERPFVTIPLAEIAFDECVKGTKISTVARRHAREEAKCLKVMGKKELQFV